MQQGQTALICASRENHYECVRVLVEAGADLDAADQVRSRHTSFGARGSFV